MKLCSILVSGKLFTKYSERPIIKICGLSLESFPEILTALGNALKVKGFGKRREDEQKAILREKLKKEKYLVIIDNFETVKKDKEVYEFLKSQGGGGSRMLITSREKLGLTGFEMPKDLESLSPKDGYSLFMEIASKEGIHTFTTYLFNL